MQKINEQENEINSRLFQKLTTELLKGEDKYMQGKWKKWRECIKTDFHGQDVPYDM